MELSNNSKPLSRHGSFRVSLLATCLFSLLGCYVFLAGSRNSIALSMQSSGRARTGVDHIVFGIAGGAEVWEHRKNYVKAWWQANRMRGHVWFDRMPSDVSDDPSLPKLMVSSITELQFVGDDSEKRNMVRIARIFMEMLQLKLPDVHWFVLGDDDTVFVVDNLVRVLSKYDHTRYYYIGAHSETHLQNVQGFSNGMAYGGAGFAISYALAQALSRVHDTCLQRYHHLYGGDGRMHACLAELGVPLTREEGFHQLDIRGDASGLLGAHPTLPLVSLHHIDLISPIFPHMERAKAVTRLLEMSEADPGGILQQSFCYDIKHNWSIKVSWGYSVQILRQIVLARDLEVPLRTFLGWRYETDESGFSFKTKPVPPDLCQRPVSFFVVNVTKHWHGTTTIYERDLGSTKCFADSGGDALDNLDRIEVRKDYTADSWYEVPQRQCCRIEKQGNHFLGVHVRDCKDGEVSSI